MSPRIVLRQAQDAERSRSILLEGLTLSEPEGRVEGSFDERTV